MKLKVKKDFKDLKTNIIRKKDETFETDENRAKELIQKRICRRDCRRNKSKERKSNSYKHSRDSNSGEIKNAKRK